MFTCARCCFPFCHAAGSAHVRRVSCAQAERLCARLGQICAAEGLGAERAVLRALGERMGHDVRAALNALQFLNRRALAAHYCSARHSVHGRRLTHLHCIVCVDPLVCCRNILIEPMLASRMLWSEIPSWAHNCNCRAQIL